ncbi:hypothetical protein [Alkalihalobacillus deserti]|uniref:hypothetical protein n=1 Tax=Alkalihalobacillus deserti TaxID=2879466 RepID=UPI001D13C49E|nr:hypothetical protein [Alkalihalobacillus deserti]
MSLRPIEAQGSFPNSQKSGKLQDQLQQRGQVSQDIIAQQQVEEERRKRKQVNETKSSDQARFTKEGESKQDQNKEQRPSHKDEIEPDCKHPFKGKFVDFSG